MASPRAWRKTGFWSARPAGAERIAAWLEEWLQCEWTGLKVLTAPMTTASAVLTLSGPKARAVLEAAGVDFPVGPTDFPHMTFREGHVAGIPARVFRVSFTGEVSFELNVATNRAGELWDVFSVTGAPFGLTPIGIDAWMLLRTEKGYLHVGADTDGSTLAGDVGFGHVLRRSHDFVGRRSLTLPDSCAKTGCNWWAWKLSAIRPPCQWEHICAGRRSGRGARASSPPPGSARSLAAVSRSAWCAPAAAGWERSCAWSPARASTAASSSPRRAPTILSGSG